MQLNFKLLDSDKQISNAILQTLLPTFDSYLKKILQNIRKTLPSLIREILQNSSEYSSLISGQLRYEFGIQDPDSKLTQILDIWSNNIDIDYQRPTIIGNKIKAYFTISLISKNFDDVLSSDAALVIDSLRGYQLPWLEWLLLEGNKTIISKQEVTFGSNRFSRTGYAIMTPSSKSWRVPSEFAGTINNNWITRTINNSENQINELLKKALNDEYM